MDILESFSLAWVGITSNKFRSFLTMLGMIIGVGSVIAMISIGEGGQGAILDQLSGLGTGSIIVSGGYGQMRLTYDDGQYLLDNAPSVTHMYPSASLGNVSVKAGVNSDYYSVTGTSPDYTLVEQWKPEYGSFLSEADLSNRSMVAVIGSTVSDDLFEGADPIGQNIRIAGQVFEVIGVMESKGSSASMLGGGGDSSIFVPVSTALRLTGQRYISQFTFFVSDQSLNKLAMGELKMGLRLIFGDMLDREDPFSLFSMDDLLSAMDEAIATFTLLLAGIAGISLVVGGIGIMNIMLVSVTERTREIGIRKALGARRRDLLVQFLIEAIMISLTGGVIGMTLGIGLSSLVFSYAGWAMTISTNAISLALSFSMSVGLFFGIYPANKAAQMDPIEALRYQ